MVDETLTVAGLLARVEVALASELPGPVWVRGEVTGFRRTSAGAAFFRLADPEEDASALEVAARGAIMREVDRILDGAGVGSLRDGIEVRVRGVVGLAKKRSVLHLSLLEVDPAFTAGRLAVDRAEVLRRLRADGSIDANRRLDVPLVPLRVGLVTSRGSAAHADFLHHLRKSGFRFSVKTVHSQVQGEGAPASIASSLARLGRESLDVVALVRGGGSRLDLAAFDSEEVARGIADMPVPVVTGIGHEVDRSVADEAAAIAEKTPTAAGEWLVTRVKDFADRMSTARVSIRDEARAAFARAGERLARAAEVQAGVRSVLSRQDDVLAHLRDGIAEAARSALGREQASVAALGEWFSTVGVEDSLRRGFALVTTADGREVVRSAGGLASGERLLIRFADGTVPVIVEET